jgi:hypothetical protein
MKKNWVMMLFFTFLVLNIANAMAATHVISNSEDWRDVYSTLLYAGLDGKSSDFLVNTRHSVIILNDVNKDTDLEIVSSKSKPFVFNYPDVIVREGYKKPEEISVSSANLQLIERLGQTNNFVIVSDSYGYDAIAVVPYAVITKSWVFLANRANIAEIDNIISRRSGGKVLVYGYLERAIMDVLDKYNPEVINGDDKFKNNVEIVKRYLKIKPIQQTIFTNGEFIEKEIMNGANPILFTGKENVPDEIREYLKTANITVGVLIGNELVGAATNIKRSTGVYVMVKFARGARAPTTNIAPVEGLDLFYLPSPSMQLILYSANYNRFNSNLEITYKSNSNIPVYFRGTITLISGEETFKVGDIEPIFIAPNDYKTISYPGVEIRGDTLKGSIYTLYGESSSAMDRILQKSVDISIVNVIDKCEIDIKKVSYNKQDGAFYVKVNNPGEVDCWFDVELLNILIDGIKKNLGTDGSMIIEKGKTKDIRIKSKLTDSDLSDNEIVDVAAYYGEKENNLVKVFRGKFELQIESFTLLTYVIAGVVAVAAVFLFIILILRRRRDDDDDF